MNKIKFLIYFCKNSRLFSTPEHIINLKEQQNNRTGEYVETLTDLLDSPTSETQQLQQTCQLRVSFLCQLKKKIFF